MPRVLARGWITLFSGPPAAGKSYAYQALVAAALTTGEWLDLPVQGVERVVVVDEENPRDVACARLRALGVGPEHAGRLRYFSQVGCRLGSGSWSDELLTMAGDFKPDLVVIDSASSATTTAANENDEITSMFADVLRPLARLGCAVLILHHDRKAGGAVDERVLGGMQWLGQVDRQIAFTARSRRAEAWEDGDALRASFRIKLIAGKSRQGAGISNIAASIESEQHRDGSYAWVRLEAAPAEPDRQQDVQAEVLAFLSGRGPTRHGEIAAALDVKPNDGRLRRAIEALEQHRAIVKRERGVYERA